MKKLLEEFKQFIARGNVLDMAVGVVVASAFTAIVNAVVSGLLTPIIGLLLPDTTFAEWAPGGFAIGEVINAVITFFITAAAVFAIVKAVNAVSNLKKKQEEAKMVAKGVIVCTPYYMEPNKSDFMRARMQEYVDICERLAEEYGCRFVNFQAVYDKFLQYKHSSLIAWDRVHPNQIGATLMAKEWLSKCGFEYDHTPEA